MIDCVDGHFPRYFWLCNLLTKQIGSPDEQRKAMDEVSKLIMGVFKGWTASKQEATRHWAALVFHQISKIGLQSQLELEEGAMKKIQNLLEKHNGDWDADELTGGIFPIFEDEEYPDSPLKKGRKKKKKKGTKKVKERLSEKEKKRRRKEQLRKDRDQQYKMYGDDLSEAGTWNMGHSMQNVLHDVESSVVDHHGNLMDELDHDAKVQLVEFKKQRTADRGVMFDGFCRYFMCILVRC